MLKQHSQMMISLLVVADACAVVIAWLVSYWLRFSLLPVDPSKGVPGLDDKFLPLLPLVVLAHLLIFYRLRLYRPRRDRSLFTETRDIIKAFVVAVAAVIIIDYALPETNKLSRRFILTYALIGTTLFATFRGVVRAILQYMRRRGWNMRRVAIIGSGRAAQRLLQAIRRNTWTGMDVSYFVDDFDIRENKRRSEPRPEATHSGATPDGETLRLIKGVPLLGPLADARRILEARPVDAVFVALPAEEAHRTARVLEELETSMADLRLVPQMRPSSTMRPDISSLDGLPILSLRQTPLYGWNGVLKRSFDIVVGAFCLLIAAIPMLMIAIAIKFSGPGPILYRQRRMGLDGCEFEMLKFRTMGVEAEKDGPVWSSRQNPHRTRLGGFLRRTSLDELPNLFNVLVGEMSLVGPRPERPEFIEQFKEQIPRYMLRHKMKAGMTGYAQIRGYRGDTSLRKRIQHDVHYIRHWSLALDIRILLQTVFGVWFSRHEA